MDRQSVVTLGFSLILYHIINSLRYFLFISYEVRSLHTNNGWRKREAHINWSMAMQRQHPLLELP